MTSDAHGATLRGRLLLNGVPVQDFAVSLVPNITGLFDTTPHPFHTADGRFELTDASPGTWDILIVGPGFARAFDLQRELVADRVLDLGDIVVHRGPTVRGTVTDAAGTPVGNATVMVGCRRKPTGDVLTDLSRGCLSTVTSGDGGYVLEDVTKLNPIDNLQPHVFAVAGGQQSFERNVPNQDVTIDLVVREVGTIEGTVQGPIQKRTIVVARSILDADARLITEAARDGSFRIEHAPVGDYAIAVLFPDRGMPVRITVTAAQAVHVALPVP